MTPSLLAEIRDELAPEYEIERLLGRGGMSLVYVMREVELDRLVAMKILPFQLSLDAQAPARFKREAQTAAALDHPHIVPIHRVGSGVSFLWFTMKYVRGRSLVELVRQRGPLGLGECRVIIEQVASALQYAHDRGVVHRDVKPANVLLDETGWVYVCDFGIAKTPGALPLTQTGGTLGTPTYMSPEQLYGQTLTGASDQYGLAILAYELLAGHPPFSGGSMGEVLRKQCLETPPRLADVRPDLEPRVSAALERAMRKKPSERFPTVLDLAAALGASVATDAERSAAATLAFTAARTARMHSWRGRAWRRGWPRALTAAGLVAGLAAAAWWARDGNRLEPLPTNPSTVLATTNGLAAPPLSGDTIVVSRPPAPPRDSAALFSRTAEAVSPPRTVATPPPARARVRSTRAPTPDPETEVRGLVAELARALASRRVGRVRQVYPGLSAQDAASWQAFFDGVDSLGVNLRVWRFTRRSGAADAVVIAAYRFHRRGDPGRSTDTLAITAAPTRGRWRITAIRTYPVGGGS